MTTIINSINFKAFVIGSLKSLIAYDIFVDGKPKRIGDRLTISNHCEYSVRQGNENLYLDIACYYLDTDIEQPTVLTLWTKDNKEGLKSLILHLTKTI